MEDIRIIHQFEEGNKTFIIAESVKKYCKCPSCGIVSDKIHSKYTRKMFVTGIIKRRDFGKQKRIKASI